MAQEETIKQTQAEAEEQPLESSTFLEQINKEFKPRTDRARENVESAVRTLAEYVLKDVNLVSPEVVNTIEAIKAEIDKRLTEQINLILHHEEFQELENAWRGLHHLVNNSETDEMLKIKVMNISKKELGKTLKKYKGKLWDTSPIFKKIYSEEYDSMGGEPYGCLVGDYYFDNRGEDVDLLSEMAKIAAAAHAPFITGASPLVMGMDSWEELPDPTNLAGKLTGPDYAAWRSLRESEDSRYIGLAMPRFLIRRPYGVKGDQVEEFNFEEDTEGGDSRKYAWANSAYAMAANINQAFKFYGWCSRIRGVEAGGLVTGLPVHTFPTDDGGVDMKCPTEIAIPGRREAELGNLGFMPLVHRKNEDVAAFIGAQSLQEPAKYEDPDATASAQLSARLPYLFACCRFSHYLRKMVYDQIGSYMEKEDMQKWLHKWIIQYVLKNPEDANQDLKARKPLADAEVVVEEKEGNPGYYTAKFHLRPHYQLEGLTVAISLVATLPSQK